MSVYTVAALRPKHDVRSNANANGRQLPKGSSSGRKEGFRRKLGLDLGATFATKRYRHSHSWSGLVLSLFVIFSSTLAPFSGTNTVSSALAGSTHNARTPNAASVTDYNLGNVGALAHGLQQSPQNEPLTEQHKDAATKFGDLPLAFERNVGQTDPSVEFMAHGGGGVFYFSPSEVVLSLERPNDPSTNINGHVSQVLGAAANTSPDSLSDHKLEHSGPNSRSIVRVGFVGANDTPSISGGSLLPGKVNYLLGNEQSKWHTGISTYSGIVYTELYPGVNLEYVGSAGQMKGTYTVAAGADPSRIRWRYEGVEDVRLDEMGNLQMQTARPGGDRSPDLPKSAFNLTEQAPKVWQNIDDRQVEVSARYLLAADGTISFQLGTYNPEHVLVIDPVLAYSTYLRGINGGTRPYAITVDSAGNAYVTGSTGSPSFPLANAYQATNGGSSDVFVTKFNASGNALVYSTYLGGSVIESAYDISLDAAGNAVLVGETLSPNFPLRNAYQSVCRCDYGLTYFDGFVTKLTAAGNDLVYSTYLGGSASDYATGLELDVSGNAYVVGTTQSTNFPTLVGSYQRTAGGTGDAFVTKFNSSGSPVYSTYFGGSGVDVAGGVALDSAGNAYIAGETGSTNMPVLNPYQSTFQGGTYDGFVTKLNPSGSGLIYSTYLGGSRGKDWGATIEVDGAGSAYIGGMTQSRNFPSTTGAMQTALGGDNDGFITKMNPAGNGLSYSTFLGGSGAEEV